MTDDAKGADIQRLLEAFDSIRARRPGAGVEVMRERAGDNFDALCRVVEADALLREAFGIEPETPVRLGPYRLVRELGRGATGTVHEAVDERDGRRVALKILSASLTSHPQVLARFLQEGETVARLSHEHVVRTHDAGEIEGRWILAMDYMPGGSLAGLLVKVRAASATPSPRWLACLDEASVPQVPPLRGETAGGTYARRLAAMLAPVADALHRLHTNEDPALVHRDLKPQNLLLAGDGSVKVADFGHARVVGNTLTASLAHLGTPGYMSPEQAAGRAHDVDARTDVYGLGATLYTLLTARPVASGSTLQDTYRAVLETTPPSARARLPGCPRGLSKLVMACLRKDPRDRPPDAATLAAGLEAVAAGGRPDTGVAARRGRLGLGFPRRPLALAGLLLLAVVGTGLVWPRGDRETCRLRVESIPPGSLWIDGEPRGVTPWQGELDPGLHAIRVEAGGLSGEERVQLRPGEVHLRKLRLRRGAQPSTDTDAHR